MLKTLTIAELINFKTYLRETTLETARVPDIEKKPHVTYSASHGASFYFHTHYYIA